MAKTISVVNTSSDTFQILIDRVNELITTVNTVVVTANASVSGSVTVGNAYIIGTLSSDILTANGTLRGGNVSTSNTLYITSNVFVNSSSFFVSNATSNVTITPDSVVVANTTKSLILTPLSFSIGNSTVNTFSNATNIITNDIDVVIANVTSGTVEVLTSNTVAVSTSIAVGSNLSITTTGFRTGNSTANLQINSTGIQISNGSGIFPVLFSDTISNTEFNSKFHFSNYTTTGTTAQVIDSYDLSVVRTAEYVLSVKNNSANGFMSLKLLCVHDGSSVYGTHYGLIYSNNDLGTFTTDSNATHALLKFTPTPANTTVKFFRANLGV